MEETALVKKLLFSQLSANGTIGTRVYHLVAPQGAVYPLTIFSFFFTRNFITLNGTKIFLDCGVDVKAVGKGGAMSDLNNIGSAIRKTLGPNLLNTTVTLTIDTVSYTGKVVKCMPYPDSPVTELMQVDAGVTYYYLIQSFLIWMQIV